MRRLFTSLRIFLIKNCIGETLEDSVRREIGEEAGIVVENVKYFQSQSWPLPQNSLMLGCTAVAMPDSEKVCIIDPPFHRHSLIRCPL